MKEPCEVSRNHKDALLGVIDDETGTPNTAKPNACAHMADAFSIVTPLNTEERERVIKDKQGIIVGIPEGLKPWSGGPIRENHEEVRMVMTRDFREEGDMRAKNLILPRWIHQETTPVRGIGLEDVPLIVCTCVVIRVNIVSILEG